MSESEALRQLKRMLRSFTVGSILHLLSEAYRRNSEQAHPAADPVASGRCDIVDHVLFCVGVGLDSAVGSYGP